MNKRQVKNCRDILEGYQSGFRRVRLWNILYSEHQEVMITSADGGFKTYTIGKAKLINGQPTILVKGGGSWNLAFVEAVKPEKV